MKQIISNYTYNTTSKTVTLTDFTTVRLDRLQLITNTTTNAIIYNFADSTVATASVATNVITLSAAPGSNTDKLMIIYDCLSGDPVYDGYKELASLSAGSLNADLVPSTDVSGYKSLSLQILGTWVGTITFQGSNDNTNFTNVVMQDTASGGLTPSTTSGSNKTLTAPINFRYFRARMTAYTSGTATGVAEFYTQPSLPITLGVSATQSGTWTVGANSATGSAVPANAFYVGASVGGFLTGLNATNGGSDASSYSGALVSMSAISAYNGTTFDRIRSATIASGTTGTGVPAAGMLGFDGTNYQRVKTDTSGNQTVIGSATGSAVPITAFYMGIKDGSGNLQGIVQAPQAVNTGGGGLPAAGIVGHYNATPPTLSTGNYNPVQININGFLKNVPQPQTSGGVTVAKIASAATTNATSVKASAGQIYGWSLFNTSAATKYLKFYNKASAPTVGTDVPVFIVPIAPSSNAIVMLGDLGTPLTTGIAYAITGAVADTDTTAIALNDVVGTFYYA